MVRTTARRSARRNILGAVTTLLVAVTAIAATHFAGVASSSPRASWFGHLIGRDRADAVSDGAITEADGVLPTSVTVFDDDYPGVARIDPQLLRALRRAATDAASDGIVFHVNSGWRSPEYQDLLLREAVATYGSEAAAARWVATASTSPHVSGEAVDIDSDAASWLADHGAEYGLCRVYGNEPWHYELRPEAIDRGCPPTYADPTHDPRMRK